MFTMADVKPNNEASRFANVTENDMAKIFLEKDAHNTRRATATAVRTFRLYLKEKGRPEDFENYSPKQLNDVIWRFYSEARQENGEMYKRTSMFSLRHGLQRHLLANKSVDLIHDSVFKEANNTFSTIVKNLKQNGLGGITHYPPIEKEDLLKMYQYFDINDNVKLQEKVFVDIMLYFGRHGRENIHELKVEHVAATTHPEGRVYVYLNNDELTKNHQDDTNTADGRMYSIPDDHMCPVKTFMKLKRQLNAKCPNLFQRPNVRFHQDSTRWFDNSPLGKNSIGQMMSNISQKAGLSKRYTNHSLRATSVHILDSDGKFANRHIMSVTGHKSETSLKTNTGYTGSNIKRSMSDTLFENLRQNSQKHVKVCDAAAYMENNTDLLNAEFEPLTNSQYDALLEDFTNDDMDALLCVGTENIPPMNSSMTMNMNRINTQRHPFISFNNCTNFTVNYHIKN